MVKMRIVVQSTRCSHIPWTTAFRLPLARRCHHHQSRPMVAAWPSWRLQCCFSSAATAAPPPPLDDDRPPPPPPRRTTTATGPKSVTDRGLIGTTTEYDFFGEATTFRSGPLNHVTNAMAAYDGFLLCVVSKGRTTFGGGDEHGLETKSSHSVALSWAEVLRHASVWNQNNDDERSCPMMVVVTVVPILLQAGISYVRHVDHLLRQTRNIAPGLPDVQLMDMAETVVAQKDEAGWNDRERRHLQALAYLMEGQGNGYERALLTYLRLLRECPGDALALSFALDLSQIVGDKTAALWYVSTLHRLCFVHHHSSSLVHSSSLASHNTIRNRLHTTAPWDRLRRTGMNDGVG
jgi:hypothetical protein